MQGEVSPPVIIISDETLLRDVHRIILDTTHSAAEIIEVLNPYNNSNNNINNNSSDNISESLHSKANKRVTISEEVTVFNDQQVDILQLPPALTLLYYAAIAETHIKSTSNLLHMLEILSEPEPPRLRGELLYEEGIKKKQEHIKWREEQKKAMEAEEVKECTFKPEISQSAKELAPKGLETFMEKCVEWKKASAVRLQKKAAQDRINRGEDEIMTQWKMSEKSQKFLEAFKRKGKKRDVLWEPKGPHKSFNDNFLNSSNAVSGKGKIEVKGFTGQSNNNYDNNCKDALETPSFHPVISETIGEKLEWLQRKSNEKIMETTQQSEQSDTSTKSLINAYLQRVETDKEKRKEKLEKLRRYYIEIEKEKLYEKNTGQPLFEPNALPTVMKNGTRVNFTELTQEEQREVTELLRKEHQEYILTRYLRYQRERNEGRQLHHQRSPDEVVANLLDQSNHKKHITNLRSTRSAEETFHPQINAQTRKITSRKSWQPIYERPLPRQSKSKSNSPNSLNSLNSLFTPVMKSSEVCMGRMLARSEGWEEERRRHLRRTQESLTQKLKEECRFQPQLHNINNNNNNNNNNNSSPGINSIWKTRVVDTNTLVANAEARMYTELELLRSQSALQDSEFIEALQQPLSKITLLSAPRPSRRSIAQYTKSISSSPVSRRLTYKTHSYRPQSISYSSVNNSYYYDVNNNNNKNYYVDNDDYYDDEEDYENTEDDVASDDNNNDDNDINNKNVAENLQELHDSWAILDAQTDSILKNCQYY